MPIRVKFDHARRYVEAVAEGEVSLEDIEEARRELDQRGVWYWQIQGLVGQGSDQIFVRDPFGNVIELHQIGTCRCNKGGRLHGP